MAHLFTKVHWSNKVSEEMAVQEILRQIMDQETRIIIYFTSPIFNQALIASTFKDYLIDQWGRHDIKLIGCTTTGEISNSGFFTDSIVGMSINSQHIKVGLGLVEGISQTPMSAGSEALSRAAAEMGTTLERIKSEPGYGKNYFALTLIDGIQRVEEYMMLTMKKSAELIKIVGGSAADNMEFKVTTLHVNGKIYTDAVLVALFKTNVMFQIASTHNFVPSDIFFNVTKANSKERIVYEFNGQPASKIYAHALGVTPEMLDEMVLHQNPLGVKQYNQYFLRSPLAVLPNGAMQFACFIEAGERVNLMKAQSIVESTYNAMAAIKEQLGHVTGMICFNCMGRYNSILANHAKEEIVKIMGIGPFIGFNSYGEQYNNLHMNQTLTLVAFGE